MKRRILSMLLLVVMLISLFPVQAFAEETAADSSAVPANGENGEPQQTEEAIQQDDVFSGEEVEIPDLPEAEYEEATEEESILNPETPAEPKDETEDETEDETGTESEDEAADGETDAAEKFAIRFNLTPEDLTLKVYPAESYQTEAIMPEEDGSYLLIPGEYCYDAECDGYIPVLAASFTVTESAAIDVVLEEDSVSSVMNIEVASLTESKTGSCGDNLTWSLDTAGNLTISGSGAMYDYVVDVPTNEGERVPWGTGIKTVEIGSGVTSIGTVAFNGCSSLTSVTIPNSVETIGGSAFGMCSALTSLTIGNGVKSIGMYAFINCTALSSVTIPKSVTSIGQYAFLGCSSLKHVYYRGTSAEWDGITGITSADISANVHCNIRASGKCGTNLTYGVDYDDKLTINGTGAMGEYSIDSLPWNAYKKIGIKTVEIGSGVTSISNYAFRDCEVLESVSIPDSVTSIGEGAFQNCAALKSVKIPTKVKSIGKSAFDSCAKLTNVAIPDSVTSIGEGAFQRCAALDSVTIGNRVETIGKSAFDSCAKLTSVIIPNSVTTIGDYAFNGCSALASVTIGSGVTSIGEEAFKACALKSITIPQKVETIGKSAFVNCSALESVTIDDSAATIGEYAFKDCSALKNVDLGSKLIRIDANAFYGCSALTAITIPDSVLSILEDAFEKCANLETVTIGKGVTTISQDVFVGCSKLKYIYYSGTKTQWGKITIAPSNDKLLGNDVERICLGCGDNLTWSLDPAGKLTITGTGAMENFTSNASESSVPWSDFTGKIKTVEIASGATSIGNYAFRDCKVLESVSIPDTVTTIGEKAFQGCEALESVTIPTGVTSIGKSAFDRCAKLTSVTIPDSVTSIGNYAFCDCDALASVKIPDGMTSIGGYAFANCDVLTSITIPGKVTSIGEEAFSGCAALESVKINDSAAKIGRYAFKNCAALKNVDLGSKITSIGEYAFVNCAALTDITIPGSVKIIFGHAFSKCSSLKNAEIGEGVEDIRERAFEECAGLETVTIGKGVTKIGERVFNDCGSLKYIYYSGTKTEWDGIKIDKPNSELLSTTLVCGLASGTCGSGVTWSLYSTGKLVIGGAGAMADYSDSNPAPWSKYKDDIKTVEIGPGVTNIGAYAFNSCEALESVTISEGVKSIGGGAFAYCDALASVTIGSGVETIGAYAFFNCPALTNVTIGNSVTNIGEYAFGNCFALTSVTIPEGVKTIGEYAFGNCFALTSVTIGSGVETIGAYAFFKCHALTNVTISEGVKSIGVGAFYACKALESVTIPESVKTIGGGAFYGCEDLKYVYYSGTKTQWDKITKGDGNEYLTGAVLVCELDSGSCGSGVTWSIDTVGNLTITGPGAMADYSDSNPAPWSKYKDDIKTVEIDPGVTNIGNSAFSNCAALTDITIPLTVTEIKDNAFLGCDNLNNVYYSGGVEQWKNVKIGASGNDGLDKASKQCGDLQMTIDREYITMKVKHAPASVKATVTPAEHAGLVTWSVESESEGIISVSGSADECKITPLKEGTAYVVAKIEINGVLFASARCRVDVTVNSTTEEITGVQLGATSVTTELYSRNYAEFDILLLLERSWGQSSVASEGSVANANDNKPEDNGIAITDARFEDETPAAEKFDLVVVDDRRLAVVPKIDVTDPAEVKTVKSSYSSKINVYVEGREEPYTTDTKLKLTVKKTQPKLKATVAAFNSFYLGQSNIIEITGATATAINRNTGKDKGKSTAVPAWLDLSEDGSGVLSINDDYKLKKSASGSVYLSVETEEWSIPAIVTLSVKNTYKAPKLKLSASSVKFSSVDSGGVELQLLPSVKGETLEGLNVTEIESSTDGFEVADGSFDVTTGKFKLEKDSEVTKSGKVTLTVGFGNNADTVDLKVSTQIVTPTIKLKTSTVTLNPNYDDVATVDMIITPADFKVITPDIGDTNITATPSDGNIIAQLSAEGKLIVAAEKEKLEYNKTYKVTVSINGTKSKATLTVKTSKNVDPTMTVKATGAIDLTYPDSAVKITPTVKDYSGELKYDFDNSRVEVMRGEGLITTIKIGECFDIKQDGNVLTLTNISKDLLAGYTCKMTIVMKDDDNGLLVTAKPVKITVKQTAVNLKLSKSSISLNKQYKDEAIIGVTCSTKSYTLIDSAVNDAIKITDKTGKIVYDGTEGKEKPLDVSYADGKLKVAVNDKTEYGATYKVLVSADTGYKAATLTVTIPKNTKSTVTATLKAKGSIDVIRDDTKITFTPTYKNVLCEPASEKVNIYKIDGKTETLVKTVNLEEGLKNFNADPICKYKAELEATFNGIDENGQPKVYTVKSTTKIAITVKTGTAKMKVTGTPTLYLKDENSRGKFTLTSTDLTLNAIKDIKSGGVEIKDRKYNDMFELYDYGNGQYAIGFKDNIVTAAAAKLKTASITLNIRHEGNDTAKADSTVTLKVTLVK